MSDFGAFKFGTLWKEATKAVFYISDMIQSTVQTSAQKTLGLRKLDVDYKRDIATSTKNSNTIMLIAIAVIFMAIVIAASRKKR